MAETRKVCFLTNVHPSPFEPRMYYREAKALSSAGYEVVFICQHDKAEIRDGIRIIPLPKPTNRLERMTRLAWKLFRLALEQSADVYHFHSPELIPVGLFLKLIGKTVIYDVHEAFEKKIFSKEWIKPQLRPTASRCFRWFERISSKCFDHIIAADRVVGKQFKHKNVTVVANYPVLSMLRKVSTTGKSVPKKAGQTIIIYTGGLTKERGLFQMIEAVNRLSNLNIELHLLGYFDDPRDEEIVRCMDRVKYFGFLPLERVFECLMSASIGLALFQRVPAYYYAGENTNKLFEYMACGLSVIVSDFPNLRVLVEGNKCGICVDPTSPDKIATAVRFLHENPKIMAEMGENGQKAVLNQYNWERESNKLLAIYRKLLRRNLVHT